MTRTKTLTDEQWEVIGPLRPTATGTGRPFWDHRTVVEDIIYRYHPGIAWRDLADKAYSLRAIRAIRAFQRRRGKQAVTLERADQIAHRASRGAKGGRPASYDSEAYEWRNVVERSFNVFKQGVPWPPGTTSSP